MSTERLPRGFGGIVKMKGNRRNPYMVRIKVGTIVNMEKGVAYPEYKIIGYTKTRKDGILMLQQYHENPYMFTADLTFKEMYEKTFEEYVKTRSHSSVLAYEAAFKAVPSLHNMKFRDIKVIHLQNAIDKSGKNYPTLRKIKVMFNMVYKYAMKYDYVGKDYSTYVDILKHKDKNPNSEKRNPFTKEDIDIIWSMSDDQWYQIILMLIYTGVRISELLNLKKENIDFDSQCFDVINSKTENGIRKVPIADCILPFFKGWYEFSTCDYLLCTLDKKPLTYRNYFDSYWQPLLEQIDMTRYTPHCTRHTCISLMAEAKVDTTTIKKIVGHAGAMTLTERVYTHLDTQVLVDAINKIYIPENYRKK